MEKLLICCLLCFCPISSLQGAPTTVFAELFKCITALKGMTNLNFKELCTPAIDTKECLLSTFKCYVNQSSLLKPADGQSGDDFNTLLERIKSSQNVVKLSNTSQDCHPCSNCTTKSVNDFLLNFQVLLQRLNRLQLRN